MHENIAYRSAAELAEMIRTRESSSLELTKFFIDRIESLDESTNAVVVREFENALTAAADADAKLEAGAEVGALHGVPMTIKEAYHVAGLPTTFGQVSLAENVPDWNSDVYVALRDAGAILLGKTNVPIDCADHQSYNDVYGTTNNPWNVERTPGGSSGGSAASVAAGFTSAEVGSDIGGSIRIPANFCGVYGHKPTWGIVSERGHGTSTVPGADIDLNVCGPLARTASDLALVLGIIAGPNRLRRRGWKLELPKPRKKSLSEYRVAIWADDANAPVDTEIADALLARGEQLAKLGATVSETARPDYDTRKAFETYLYLLHSAMGAGATGEELERNRRHGAAADSNDHSDAAILAKGLVLSHADWLRAHGRRERIRAAWDDFFGDWDILLCPVHQVAAFPHDHRRLSQRTHRVNGTDRPYFESLFWSGIVTGPLLPSTAFPTGLSKEGLPLGAQAVGNGYDDYVTIEFARLMEQEFGGFMPPPNFA